MKNIFVSHIQLVSKAEFLDVNIENSNGSLITSVFHKPAAEPYVLPFGSDHPRHVHINIPYEALLRAARLCSNVDTFDKERLKIEMILLLNGYPPKFIKDHFNRFFRLNQVISVFSSLDATQYETLHQKLLYLPNTKRKENVIEQGRIMRILVVVVVVVVNVWIRIMIQIQRNKWNRKILMLPHTILRVVHYWSSNMNFVNYGQSIMFYKGSLMKGCPSNDNST